MFKWESFSGAATRAHGARAPLTPPTVFSSMTAFQQPGEEEEEVERRMMRLAERLEVRGQTALQYTVCEQVHYSWGN